MSTCKGLLIFLAGAAFGSIVTGRVLKTKYERIAEEEIASVKEVYAKKVKKLEEPTKGDTEPDPTPTKEMVDEYREMVKQSGYTNYSKRKEEAEEVKNVYAPYVIEPDQFDTNDFDTKTLTLYADGILADEYDNVITNVDEIIGEESLDHFGDYEEDTVYVRNEELETDFEILKDESNYRDII